MENAPPFRFFITHPKVVLLEWDTEPDDALLNRLIEFRRAIKKEFEEVVQITQGYCSLMLFHNKAINTIDRYQTRLDLLYSSLVSFSKKKSKLWRIPVCYSEAWAPDLNALSKSLNITTDTLIKKHASVRYRVQFIGFLPGFLYLSGLPKILECARKDQPVSHVAKGSVAIGGKQTGIYPVNSPGGWHLIGKTPYPLFKPEEENPCFAQAGDSIQFEPITLKNYWELEERIKNKTFKIRPE